MRCATPCAASPCAPSAPCWSALAWPARWRWRPTARPIPSLSTAAGGPPANWLGATGAYASDLLLLLFGIGAVLFLPVIAIAGLRMLRLRAGRPAGRGLLLAAIGALLLGVALGLTSGSAVSGLARRLGRSARACRGAWRRSARRPDPQPADRGPDPAGALLLFALAGLAVGYFALGLQPRGARLARRPFPPPAARAPRRAAQDRAARRTPRSRPRRPSHARPSPSPSRPGRRRRQAAPQAASLARAAEPRARRQLPAADARPAGAAARGKRGSRSTAPGSSATRGCSKPCSRISMSAATSSRSARARSSPCTSSSRRAGSRPAGSSRWPTTSPATCRRCRRASRRSPAAASSASSCPIPSARRCRCPSWSEARRSRTRTCAAADPRQEYRRRPGHRRPCADAAPARRRHHRVGQVGRPQLHDPVAALPLRPGPVQNDHDRPEDARTEHVRRHPASARAGGDRAGQGDPRAQMDRRADGRALSDDGQCRRPRAAELQCQGARGQGQGRQARAAGADRL